MGVVRIASLLLLWISLASQGRAEPVDLERLNTRLETLAADPSIVGLAVAVIEDGEITFAEGYGETQAGADPVTAQTVFRWASLSKGVASTLTGQLSEDGTLGLDDTLASFGTSLRLPGNGEREATLEHILSHMIGIVPNAYDTRLEDGRDPADIRRSLGALKAVCPVGECHTYQNVAFDAVTEAIEQATGKAFSEVAGTELFEPLGMATASIGRAALEASQDWARPHERRRGQVRPLLKRVKDAYYRVPAAGGVNGSILDLAVFARAQMGLVPETVAEQTLAKLHTPRVYTRREQSSMSRRYGGHLKDARYALGWRSYKYADTGARVVGHRGAVEGYRSLILLDPERDTGIVALWNSNSRRPVGVQFEVMDMAYGLPARDWLGLDGAAMGAAR